jgi:hypothetical protein
MKKQQPAALRSRIQCEPALNSGPPFPSSSLPRITTPAPSWCHDRGITRDSPADLLRPGEVALILSPQFSGVNEGDPNLVLSYTHNRA